MSLILWNGRCVDSCAIGYYVRLKAINSANIINSSNSNNIINNNSDINAIKMCG